MMNGHLRRDMKSFKRGSLVAVWGRGQVSGRKAAAGGRSKCKALRRCVLACVRKAGWLPSSVRSWNRREGFGSL